MDHWEKLRSTGDEYTIWVNNDPNDPNTPNNPNKPTGEEACLFFLKVILNQGQNSGRARLAAEEFVEKFYEINEKSFWEKISRMREADLKEKCKFENGIHRGKNYAVRGNTKKFPSQMIENAKIIIKDYNGEVKNIWEDITSPNQEQVDLLQKRFKRFDGIGEELSRMAVFQLVRKLGVAGGWKARRFLKVKRDTHLLNVIANAFLGNADASDNDKKDFADSLVLDSPADFDHAAFDIGKKFCLKKGEPKCPECPIRKACNAYKKR